MTKPISNTFSICCLECSSKDYIIFTEIQEKCGIESKRISKVLGSKTVKPVLKARNWVKKSMRQALGSGRGIVLVRI